MYRILSIVVILLFLTAIPVYTLQDSNYVVISSIEGNVEKYTGGDLFNPKAWSDIFENDLIGEGDLLRTGENSRVEIQFSNETLVMIGPDSEFKIGEGEVAEMGLTSSLYLEQGRIWAKVKKVWRGFTKFKVITPSAVAGVRGTIFSVMVEDNNVLLSVKEGEVNFKTIDKKREVNVGRGYMSSVKFGKLQDPVGIDEIEEKEWNKVKDILTGNENNKGVFLPGKNFEKQDDKSEKEAENEDDDINEENEIDEDDEDNEIDEDDEDDEDDDFDDEEDIDEDDCDNGENNTPTVGKDDKSFLPNNVKNNDDD